MDFYDLMRLAKARWDSRDVFIDTAESETGVLLVVRDRPLGVPPHRGPALERIWLDHDVAAPFLVPDAVRGGKMMHALVADPLSRSRLVRL